MVTIWLELCTSYSSHCISITISSDIIQNRDILVLANPGTPGKMAVKMVDAATNSLHWLLSPAISWSETRCLPMSYLEIPAVCKSSSTQSIQHFFGLPSDCLLIGSQLNTCFTVLLSDIRRMCPVNSSNLCSFSNFSVGNTINKHLSSFLFLLSMSKTVNRYRHHTCVEEP